MKITSMNIYQNSCSAAAAVNLLKFKRGLFDFINYYQTFEYQYTNADEM